MHMTRQEITNAIIDMVMSRTSPTNGMLRGFRRWLDAQPREELARIFTIERAV